MTDKHSAQIISNLRTVRVTSILDSANPLHI